MAALVVLRNLQLVEDPLLVRSVVGPISGSTAGRALRVPMPLDLAPHRPKTGDYHTKGERTRPFAGPVHLELSDGSSSLIFTLPDINLDRYLLPCSGQPIYLPGMLPRLRLTSSTALGAGRTGTVYPLDLEHTHESWTSAQLKSDNGSAVPVTPSRPADSEADSSFSSDDSDSSEKVVTPPPHWPIKAVAKFVCPYLAVGGPDDRQTRGSGLHQRPTDFINAAEYEAQQYQVSRMFQASGDLPRFHGLYRIPVKAGPDGLHALLDKESELHIYCLIIARTGHRVASTWSGYDAFYK